MMARRECVSGREFGKRHGVKEVIIQQEEPTGKLKATRRGQKGGLTSREEKD